MRAEVRVAFYLLRDRYKALKEAGFQLDAEGDLMQHLLERCGGHYIDHGDAVSLIASKQVAVKSGVSPTSYTAHGLSLSDGSSLSADAIIWCTGYADTDVRHTAASVFGQGGEKLAQRMDASWRLDAEGELRGLWKRHEQVEAFWLAGGFTSQQRFYSRFLAMQIKAALEGVLPEAYRGVPEPVP